ncbi:MFS transporter [Lactiplantibacillus garii]|uniref:MFS transporter n=1 Tax=Lactiplantibacillus garii TaxID=2306423 RepID=A0A3R8KJ53_9LACO|nr:MFS transporter [Lactiplantibacillus garii]RRK10833.1 MFS transporter [Lactiplantibacillus garii]
MHALSIKSRLALMAMALTFFSVGVTEFISVGVLPAVAADFKISTATAGMITSLYALGVAIGGPVLAVLTVKASRRRVILGALVAFVAGHLLISLAPTFTWLLIGRFAAATAHGILFALSSTIAAELVSQERQAWAIAFIFGGFTVATALGAPLGTLISDNFGWRLPFLVIALLGVLAFLINWQTLPLDQRNQQIPTWHEQWRLLTNRAIALMLLVTILGYGGTFVAFTYLSPILQTVTHVSAQWISLILVIYGLAIAFGNWLGGRLTPTEPLRLLAGIFLLQAGALVSFYWTSQHLLPAVLTIIVLGSLGFMNVPILQAYVLQLAQRHEPNAVNLAAALNIAGFSVGIALGTFVGGIITDVWGLRLTAIAASIMVFLGYLLTWQLQRHQD